MIDSTWIPGSDTEKDKNKRRSGKDEKRQNKTKDARAHNTNVLPTGQKKNTQTAGLTYQVGVVRNDAQLQPRGDPDTWKGERNRRRFVQQPNHGAGQLNFVCGESARRRQRKIRNERNHPETDQKKGEPRRSHHNIFQHTAGTHPARQQSVGCGRLTRCRPRRTTWRTGRPSRRPSGRSRGRPGRWAAGTNGSGPGCAVLRGQQGAGGWGQKGLCGRRSAGGWQAQFGCSHEVAVRVLIKGVSCWRVDCPQQRMDSVDTTSHVPDEYHA